MYPENRTRQKKKKENLENLFPTNFLGKLEEQMITSLTSNCWFQSNLLSIFTSLLIFEVYSFLEDQRAVILIYFPFVFPETILITKLKKNISSQSRI